MLNEEDENATPDLSKVEMKDLLVEDQLAIQAYINYLFITLPTKEETTFDMIRPYYNVCV